MVLAKHKKSRIEIDLLEYAIAKAKTELPEAYATLTDEERKELNKGKEIEEI